MGEQIDGHPAEGGQRFTDRGARFTRRRFLGKTGIAALTVGTAVLVTGCQFDNGYYQGRSVQQITGNKQGSDTGQSSTSGQNATPSPSPSASTSSSNSQSAMSS